jgi:hypothetical protein
VPSLLPKSSASIKITQIKKGRRLYGGIHTVTATGNTFYLAYRRIKEIYRSGEKSISDAVRLGTACWAIDEATLLEMRAKGIKYIGVFVRDNGDTYLTSIDNYFDKTKAKILNYEKRGGSLQRFLPLIYFRVKHGAVKLKSR